MYKIKAYDILIIIWILPITIHNKNNKYKDHLIIYGHLTSLRNKPQQKQLWNNTGLNC